MLSLTHLILWTIISTETSLGNFEFYEDKVYKNVFYENGDSKYISYFVDSTDLSEDAAEILKFSKSMSVYRNFVQQTVENLPATEMMAKILETDEINFEILGKNRKSTKYILRPTKHILMVRNGTTINLGNFYSATFTEGNVIFKYTNGDRNFGNGTNSTNIQFAGALSPAYRKYYLGGIDLYGFTIELPELTRIRYQVGLKTQIKKDAIVSRNNDEKDLKNDTTDNHNSGNADEISTVHGGMESEHIDSVVNDPVSPDSFSTEHYL